MTKKFTTAAPAKTAKPKAAAAPALKRTPVAAAAAQTSAPAEEPTEALPAAVGGELLEPASDAELEKAVEALPNPAPRLTMEHIQRVIVDEIYTRIEGTLTTICTLKLRNGYTVVGVNNGPVSPENFDQQVACEYAYKGAVNQIWTLEGYLLKEFLAAAKDKSELNPIGEIAKACHEANAALCRAFGDNSQPTWDDAPDWQRMSAINGVSFHLANPDAGPESSHGAWLAQKEAEGWVWGEVKDADAKTHPCMLPFDELPPEQQAKDHVFRALVHTLAGGRHG